MTIFLIIVGIILGLLGVFLISNRISIKKSIQENNDICDAHKKLGYPELEKDVQFKIMETGDLTPIAQIIPELSEKGTPYTLLKHYIKISKKDFNDYLFNSDFLERQKIENAPNPNYDGFWIKGNEIIEQERGHIYNTWSTSNDKEAINFYCDLLWEKINFK